jgi:ELWxxDGT repeat protein
VVVSKPNTASARVRVSWAANLPTSDTSDVDFTIGTPAYLVKNINGASSGSPSMLTNVGGTVFFTASDLFTTGRELWKSDGTDAGTVLVKDITPGPVSTDIASLTAVGNTLFFLTDSNKSLWKSSGSAAGTVLVGTLPVSRGPASFPA